MLLVAEVPDVSTAVTNDPREGEREVLSVRAVLHYHMEILA